MSHMVFTPQATLLWRDDTASDDVGSDWRERLFQLAAERPALIEPVPRFWQKFAETLLTALCHSVVEESAVSPPDTSALTIWVETAPPMPGGEYVCVDTLLTLWNALYDWCAARAAERGGMAAFLEACAPRWRQIGRVSFHLAENRTDAGRPFAFMVTYVDGLNAENRPRHLPLGHALQRYAGEGNREALIRLLSPIHAAAEALSWVRTLVDDKRVFQPLAFTAERAHRLLLDAPALETCGISVRLPDWWKRRPRPTAKVRLGNRQAGVLGLESLVDFDVRVALGDMELSPEEVETLLAGPNGLLQFKGQWVEVDKKRLTEVLRHWKVHREAVREGMMTFAEAMRLLAGFPEDAHAESEKGTEKSTFHWCTVEVGEALRERLTALRKPGMDDPPPGLRATLRPYQREGLAWLRLLSGMGLGACLADDMGLGKTIQVLALLLHDKARTTPNSAPALLVLPASLLGNWRAEAEKFAPELRLAFLHPSETPKETLNEWLAHPERLAEFDLVAITYAMLTRHVETLAAIHWRRLILDEAQAVKNPDTRQTRAVRRLPAETRIALTGTPVENRLSDLWSLFHCINPGLLGTATAFKHLVARLEQRDEDRYGPLRRLVGPYILRRMKTDKRVIDDLPDKTETTVFCQLAPAQVKLYKQVVEELEKALVHAGESDDIRRKGLVLQTLMRLKQICNHPSQFTGTGDYRPDVSGKFLRLGELCAEMASRQERTLVFTQYREIIEPLCGYLETIFGRPGLALHGGTRITRRRELVDAFQQSDGPPFFVISLKAGGTGLNLTAASQVIHFDRWWNPAVEDQATDRAFRIGQKRAVMVHKCVVRGTLEERIDALIMNKRQLAGELLEGGEELNLVGMSDAALLDVIRLDVSRASL